LCGHACQDQKQDEFGPALCPQHREQPDALGELLEDKQDSKDGATDGLQVPREAIKLAFESAAHGLDPLWGPRGEVGEGARTHLVPVAEGLAEENGGRGVAIGDSCYIHECIDSTHTPINLEEILYLHDYILVRKMD
jgi:hypothetical protein